MHLRIPRELLSEFKGFAVCTLNNSRICFVCSYTYLIKSTVVLTAAVMLTLCYGTTNRFVWIRTICHFLFPKPFCPHYIVFPLISMEGTRKVRKIYVSSFSKYLFTFRDTIYLSGSDIFPGKCGLFTAHIVCVK